MTIEKDDQIFDIFFVDSEGLTLANDRTKGVNDSFASDVVGDRQKRLLSILLGISTFVVFNGKPVDIQRSMDAMAVPEDPCLVSDRQLSLLWLLRDTDTDDEQLPADALIQNLFSTEPNLETVSSPKHINALKTTFPIQYGYSLPWPNA